MFSWNVLGREFEEDERWIGKHRTLCARKQSKIVILTLTYVPRAPSPKANC